MRNCGSQILKIRNRSSATFFCPQLRNRFGCPQYYGVAEVRTDIADPTFAYDRTMSNFLIIKSGCGDNLNLVKNYGTPPKSHCVAKTFPAPPPPPPPKNTQGGAGLI